MRYEMPHEEFNLLVHDISRMRRTLFDQTLKPLGITRAQWWALDNIARSPESGMIQTEVARVLDTGKVSVGGLIDRLESAGLVRRKPDKTDRRVKRIFLTDKAAEVLEHIAAVVNALDEKVFQNVTPSDVAATAAVMHRIKDNIREAAHELRADDQAAALDDVAA